MDQQMYQSGALTQAECEMIAEALQLHALRHPRFADISLALHNQFANPETEMISLDEIEVLVDQGAI